MICTKEEGSRDDSKEKAAVMTQREGSRDHLKRKGSREDTIEEGSCDFSKKRAAVITQKKRARSCDNSKKRASKLWASKLRLPDTSDVRERRGRPAGSTCSAIIDAESCFSLVPSNT